MNKQNNHFFNPVRCLLATALLVAPLAASAVASYSAQEIPKPAVSTPSGTVGKYFCVSVNHPGTVACNMTFWKSTPPGVLMDRGAPNPGLVASYVFTWDSLSGTTTQISPDLGANRIDVATAINDSGVIVGTTKPTANDKPQGVLWISPGTPVLKGPGPIIDINANGDYVQNKQLFDRNGVAIISFPGKQVEVESVNDNRNAAGTQALSGNLSDKGTGELYPTAPALTGTPLYATSTIDPAYRANSISINGDYVISSNNGSAAMKCHGYQHICRIYQPLVGSQTFGRVLPTLSLYAINSANIAVGQDTGQAILIDATGVKRFLDNLLPTGSGWTTSYAYDINDVGQGKIVGSGFHNFKQAAFLLTPL